jgi:NADH-quinone oxidoreductase subunit A
VRFDIRFYTVALIFLIFDVEVTFLYPWALVFKAFRDSGLGVFVLAEVLLFIAILGVGFVYCWRKGDLDWVKGTPKPAFPARRVARPAGEPIQAAAAARPPAPESPGREAKVPATVG